MEWTMVEKRDKIKCFKILFLNVCGINPDYPGRIREVWMNEGEVEWSGIG